MAINRAGRGEGRSSRGFKADSHLSKHSSMEIRAEVITRVTVETRQDRFVVYFGWRFVDERQCESAFSCVLNDQ